MGALYVVATPIGNLDDLSSRAIAVLRQVDWVAAEDTRHTQKLLNYFSIKQRLLSLHEWNQNKRVTEIMKLLNAGQSVALVCDAGTPLISDPGFPLVREVQRQQLSIVPIPGPSALIAALSVAGLPTERFVFEGFLPAKGDKRLKRLEVLAQETRTLVFYESCHRIENLLQQLVEIFGAGRQVCVARELTKTYETILLGKAAELSELVSSDSNQRKGEFVIVVAGHEKAHSSLSFEAEQTLKLLLDELTVKQAVKLAQKLTAASRQALYDYALKIKKGGQ